jgi:hypothetical protein
MPSTHKKVVVRKLNRDSLSGYVGSDFIVENRVQVLNQAGNVVQIDLADIKGVFFVREFSDSEAPARKTFTSRPRSEGLWVRMRFRDNEVMEGMMPNDLGQISPAGFFVNPPDTGSNTQRIFVPRTALTEIKVLAVIGAQPRKRKAAASDERQREMFEEEHSA